jgi:cytochrome oxidase Cu insertion factor (SCO1/SenC/PrrC family)
VSRPKPASRRRPPHTAPSSSSRPTAGWPLWLSLAAVAVLGVVVVVWLTGRPSSVEGTGQPAGGVRAVGQLAPPVRLPSTTGQTIDLAGFRGKRNVLLYFYEHAG